MQRPSKVLIICLLVTNALPLAVLWSPEFLSRTIIPLAKYMYLQEMLWFLSERLTTNDTENLQEFMVSVHNAVGVTQLVITNRSDMRLTKMSTRKNHMGMVFTTGPEDPIMLVHDRVTLGKHFFFNIVVYVRLLDDFTIIEHLFRDLIARRLQNSVVHFRRTNGASEQYGATIFPEPKIENRTNFLEFLRSNMKQIQSGGVDVFGKRYHTPLSLDVPGVFPLQQRNTVNYQGFAYRILDSFMDYINGSLVKYEMPGDPSGGTVINMAEALQLVRDNKIPLLAHAYALFAIDDTIDKSYPLMVVKWCLMVPRWNSVSTLFYPIKPFAATVWYAIMISFLALIILDFIWLLMPFAHPPHTTFYVRLLDAILHSYCLLFNISTGKTLLAPKLRRYFLTVCIFFCGFFVSANYTSLLGSILTVNLFRGQINTMQDLINANLTVMIIDYELEFLLSGGKDLPAAFLNLLKPVDVGVFNAHQMSFNSSYAYFVTENVWSFINLQQQYLKQHLFKFSDICFGSYHLAYPMQTDSPIWRNLEYYVYRVHSSGMLQYYEHITFDYAIEGGYVQRLTESTEYTSATMQHLAIIFFALLTVYALATVIFILELLIGYNVLKLSG